MSFPIATIDSGALRNNLRVARRLAPRSRVLAVVKADAYGHGIVHTAKTLVDADAFGVARLSEALTLRAASVAHPIVLLEGVTTAEELAAAAQHRCDVVVHSFEQIEMLEQAPAGLSICAWLKLDTGMSRLGFRMEDFDRARHRTSACRAVKAVRVMTHLAAAEEPHSATTQRQIETFQMVAGALPWEKSIVNSAGLIGRPDAHADWVRPGLMLYGMSPLGEESARDLGLQPAMTLSAPLIAVRSVKRGEAVGYNGLWRAERDTRIGIAAIGYGDGYPRTMGAGAPVLVEGRASTIVGRVSMDMTAVDLSHLDDAKVGSEVVLWGRGLPAERVAAYADTIAYELVCRVNERVAIRHI